MKTIKWLINLANVKPIIFCVAMLLIAILTLTVVIVERNNKVNRCDAEKIKLKEEYEAKLSVVYKEESRLQEEVKQILNSIIEGYKSELEEQKQLNAEMQKTIDKNKTLINKNSNNEQ